MQALRFFPRLFRRQEIHGNPDPGVFFAEPVDDEGEVVGAEALAGEDLDEPPFALLEIAKASSA